MEKNLQELAVLLGGEVCGDSLLLISGVANIAEAGLGDITFAVSPHLEKAAQSQAAAVIIPVDVTDFPKPAIKVANPRLAFCELLTLFTPVPPVKPGIHPTAVVGENVKLGKNVTIMAHTVIDDQAEIGDNTIIYPQCYLGREVVVGANTLLHAHVTVYAACRLGDRVIVHSGAVIGSDGFGFVTVDGVHRKVPQVGNVIIADDVEIGALSAVDRATINSTIVGQGTKVDNLVHLAHNVQVGKNCFFVAQTGIAGSAKIGNNVTFAGQSGSAGHLTIGDNCVFAARAAAISDVPANSFCAGFPARPHREWLRSEAAARKTPELLRTVRQLEKKLAELEARLEK